MPSVSVVIPCYNVRPYVARCLESVRRQAPVDFEAIVVDDASNDGTAEAIDSCVGDDRRFIVVRHEINKGLHVARMTGVSQATGDYVAFLDGDDELADGTLETLLDHLRVEPVDILHFGLDVVDEEGALVRDNPFEGDSVEGRGALRGEEIIRATFDWNSSFSVDWRVTHRLFDANLVRRSFAVMTGDRLERAEDSYEFLVIASMATSMGFLDTCRGYLYHYGLGIMGESGIDLDRFERDCLGFKGCIEAAKSYGSAHQGIVPQACVDGFVYQNLVFLANEWLDRVPDSDKRAAADLFAECFGEVHVGAELWRIVRDRAYGFIARNELPAEDDPLAFYCDIASSVEPISGSEQDVMRYERMRRIAESHLAQLDGMRQLDAYRAEPVRVFVTTHKPVDVPAGSCFQPVQVGPALRRPGGRFPDSFHDDDGADNISDRNPMYCEMTVQYWAWKNALAGADYVGFCHYRRYFNLSGATYEENPYGEIMDDYIDGDAVRRYGLDDEHVRAAVEGYDVITTGFHSLASIPGDFSTPLEHYESAPLLHVGDLRRVIDILSRMHPEYERDAREFLSARDACFCNMYVMRAEIFSAYCDWLFPVLDEFMAETDMSRYSKEALRTPGHLAERLFNIYYRHAMRTGAGWRTKQVQCVHFTSPDREYPLEPIVLSRPEAAESGVVPVVFASDDAYVPMLTTTILSMLSNADRTRFYDIVVLERNIGPAKRAAVEEVVSRFGNASVRFHNVARMVHGYDLGTNNEHISMETYYRFLVQDILSDYDKVLYLDSDLIVRGDVAELFDVELGDDLLAAARDVDYLGNLNMNDGKRMAYTTERLGLAEPYDYFQAGVLVLNTCALRDLHTVPEWMRIVSEADFIFDDQDILNAECQGRVTFLPFEWNVMHDCGGRVDAVFKFAPNDAFDAYMASRANPKVVHYAGWEKPWVNPDCDFAAEYWRYARQTPFYETLIARLASNVAGVAPAHVMPVHEKAVSPTSPLRRVIDPIAPYGTARREVLKAIGRAARGRK